MNVYYNRETGKRVTTWPQSGKRRVEMLKPDIHLYLKYKDKNID